MIFVGIATAVVRDLLELEGIGERDLNEDVILIEGLF